MTGPKKPCLTAAAPTAAPLTVDQLRLLRHFAAMGDEAQAAMLAMTAEMAKSCPRRVRPVLRIVGGAS